MFVQTATQIAELNAYQRPWDELAGDSPFRSWAWLSTWWKHYGAGHDLLVLLVFDDTPPCTSESSCRTGLPGTDKLVAILPLYLETTHTRGRVLRLLGDGEVCSEHLDLLCNSTRVAEVSQTLA